MVQETAGRNTPVTWKSDLQRDITGLELMLTARVGFKDSIFIYLLLLLFCFVGDTDGAHAKPMVVY